MAPRNCSRKCLARKANMREALLVLRNCHLGPALKWSWWPKSPIKAELVRDATRPHFCNLKRFVQKQNICVGPSTQRALLEFNSKHGCGVHCQHAHCVCERNPKPHNIAQGAVECKCASRKPSLAVPANSVDNYKLDSSQSIFSVGHSCCHRAVADQDHALRSFCLQQHLHSNFIDVNAVRDQFRVHLRRGQYRPDNTRISVRKRAHCIVDMSGMMGAVCDCCASLLEGGIGVANGHNHAQAACGVNAWHRPEQLWSNGQNARIAGRGVKQLLQHFQGWRLQHFCWMHTATLFAQEWSLEMHSEDFRP